MPCACLHIATLSSASCTICIILFFTDTATNYIYTLSLHDALPILEMCCQLPSLYPRQERAPRGLGDVPRSEEHTSELQSRVDLVCRLLLEKKNYIEITVIQSHEGARAYLSCAILNGSGRYIRSLCR